MWSMGGHSVRVGLSVHTSLDAGPHSTKQTRVGKTDKVGPSLLPASSFTEAWAAKKGLRSSCPRETEAGGASLVTSPQNAV